MTDNAFSQPPRLATAAELATQLGVSRAYVYEHAERLGAIRLGRGPRARLRFDPIDVMSQLRFGVAQESVTAQTRKSAHTKKGRPSTDTTRGGSLLPIKNAGVQ